MIKQLKFGLLAIALIGFMASCSNDTDVREAAADSVEGSTVSPTAAAPEAAANAQAQPAETAPAGPTTTVQFKESEFDFGKIDQGESVTHSYTFTNTGSEPLIISSAKGSCGCTVPKWPKEPIAPGETGELLVEFNSKGKRGVQNKKVTITANTSPQQSFIYLKGEVIAPEGAAPANQPVTQ
jgi:hypothetical protein